MQEPGDTLTPVCVLQSYMQQQLLPPYVTTRCDRHSSVRSDPEVMSSVSLPAAGLESGCRWKQKPDVRLNTDQSA